MCEVIKDTLRVTLLACTYRYDMVDLITNEVGASLLVNELMERIICMHQLS